MKTLILTVDPEVFKHGDFITGSSLTVVLLLLILSDVWNMSCSMDQLSVEKNNEKLVEKHNMPVLSLVLRIVKMLKLSTTADWYETIQEM